MSDYKLDKIDLKILKIVGKIARLPIYGFVPR